MSSIRRRPPHYVVCITSTLVHLGNNCVVQSKPTTGVTLVGVELDLQHLAQGLDVGGRRLAAVPGGSASLSRVSSGDGDVVRAAISAGGHVKLAEAGKDFLSRSSFYAPDTAEEGRIVVRIARTCYRSILNQCPVNLLPTLDTWRGHRWVDLRWGIRLLPAGNVFESIVAFGDLRNLLVVAHQRILHCVVDPLLLGVRAPRMLLSMLLVSYCDLHHLRSSHSCLGQQRQEEKMDRGRHT